MRKGIAFWWLIARLAGWDGIEDGGSTTSTITTTTSTVRATTTTTSTIRPGTTTSTSGGGTTSTAAPPTTLPAGGSLSKTLEFPQVAFDGGYSTFIYLMNPNAVSAIAQVDLRNGSGQQMAAGLEMGMSPGGGISIQSLSFAVVRLTGTGSSVKTGWCRITTDIPVAGIILFQAGEAESLVARASVFPSPRGTRFVLMAPHPEPDVDVGLAVANPNSQPVTVRLRLIAVNGSTAAEMQFSLNAGEQRARFRKFSNIGQRVNPVVFS